MERIALREELDLLLTSRRFAAIREILAEEKPTDIAEFFEELNKERLVVLYRILPKELAAEVFVEMSSEQAELLIDSFSDFELRETLGEMYTDDTVDLIEEMPAGVVRRILANADPTMRQALNELLKYPEESVGSIMSSFPE